MLPSAIITLTGKSYEWEHSDCLYEEIPPSQIEYYEREGWIVSSNSLQVASDKLLGLKLVPHENGDIELKSGLDMLGRHAASGSHTNYGYSGYFKGYVYEGGKRRRLVDFWKLFPNQEHHYPTQGEKGAAFERVKQTIEGLAGTQVVKVKGGYAFYPE